MDHRTENNYLILFKCINPKHHEALRLVLEGSQEGTLDFLQILKRFDALDNIRETQRPAYKYDFQADLMCLKEVFKETSIKEDEIRTTLKILTGVPNPAMVAAKLFLHKIETKQSVDRKRTATCNEIAVTTKQIKYQSDEIIDLDAIAPLDEASGPVFLEPNKVQLESNYSLSFNNPKRLPRNTPAALGVASKTTADEPQSSDSCVIVIAPSISDTSEEDAAAPAPGVLLGDQRLTRKVLEMFPDVSRDYLNQICQDKTYNDATFAEVLDLMLETDYPKAPPRTPSPEISVTHEEQLAMLKEMLPDADPTFLEAKVQELGDNKRALEQFLENILATKKYPTMKEYLRRKQLSAQQRQYTTEFNVQRFVELFPNPNAIFEAPDRKSPMLSENDFLYVSVFMRKMYPQLYAKDIGAALRSCKSIKDIVNTLDGLVAKGVVKKAIRAPIWRADVDCQNIPLLQELAYIEHKNEICNYIKKKKVQDAEHRMQAKIMGQLQTCTCCFDDEVMPNDIVNCPQGCRFCKSCVKRSSEIAVGEGKVNFPCLSGNCNTEFSLQVLQTVLEPKVFSKMAQKKALAEVKAALLDELESCPFCDFANIPAPEDKLFRCLNPDCMKESCRLCKEPSHVPLRCEEVEKDENVKARTYIENKMTDALIRECWSCKNRFYKDEGCNKMTCVCGAMTCYVCRKPVRDYTHFNGQGGDRHDLCPLYTDNFTVNENKVLEAAEIAKKEVGEDKLKCDPTVGLENHLNAQKARGSTRATQVRVRIPPPPFQFLPEPAPNIPNVLAENRLDAIIGRMAPIPLQLHFNELVRELGPRPDGPPPYYRPGHR